ncbi:hypothetical protein VTN00DRAFT_6898 [Thermoascus crustaceus]|uniref:uncharacterized protein n=1 Tax=Thermoascus crustaceus TaxID=5088 RepID=UPI0037439975
MPQASSVAHTLTHECKAASPANYTLGRIGCLLHQGTLAQNFRNCSLLNAGSGLRQPKDVLLHTILKQTSLSGIALSKSQRRHFVIVEAKAEGFDYSHDAKGIIVFRDEDPKELEVDS